ncbi:hypothetical protein [Silvibacterium dinghuense]|uniref:DUF3108 domain-containing protein n=1 Tax=Silvibacterium dinghuense TaxID=1560006 RepID=A0A4Q1S9M2_9BACT|nr:hypothetical protein [Silvibacterium dinghuense]RXS93728.1 hypothetical protein ESZ00_16900 [Silvibacterium dinghuense]GGH07164.1 hypothetical protein GCM10011586_24280 [Silvibacterium dinghuense]
MRFLNALLLSALAVPVAAMAQTSLPAGTQHFVLYQGDKTVGSADRTIQPTGVGYTLTSQGKVSLSKFSYSFSQTQHLDKSLNLVSSQITGNVNGKPVTFTAHADSTGREFQLGINADGKNTQNSVDRHQHLVLLSDLDPAAYTILTQIVIQKPQTSWALIPKEQGILVPTDLTPDTSVRGRLNGNQIDVQHATVVVGEQNPVSVELFYGHDGDLLEADLPEQNFYVVRDGFKLIDRPKPVLPRGQNPPAQDQQGQQQQYPQPQQQ